MNTPKLLIKNARVINEGQDFRTDILVENNIISKIAPSISVQGAFSEINAESLILMPGVVDDQVHFREPGLTHKATIETESIAAIMGGVTSFMEMPNTNPPAYTIDLLEEKYQLASQHAYSNYSFFLGASNDNVEELKKMNIQDICGIKIFMGSSTGNLLVDREEALNNIFKYAPTLIATHCEEESIIRAQKVLFESIVEQNPDPAYHPKIRNHEACIVSSQKAIALAKKYDSRLHILHISTAQEVGLFDNSLPLSQKRITSEACVHHLWFNDSDYAKYGNQIICNPAIKSKEDQMAIWKGLLDNHIDIIATDHAPHTWEEKSKHYPNCPSGVPLVQHSLLMMMEKVNEGYFTLEKMVEKMCHAPAICFKLKNRGFIREGYFADLVLVNPKKKTAVTKESLIYKCQWSPFEHHTFSNFIEYTILNGQIINNQGTFTKIKNAQRLQFN
jgi:dihydroorotase